MRTKRYEWWPKKKSNGNFVMAQTRKEVTRSPPTYRMIIQGIKKHKWSKQYKAKTVQSPQESKKTKQTTFATRHKVTKWEELREMAQKASDKTNDERAHCHVCTLVSQWPALACQKVWDSASSITHVPQEGSFRMNPRLLQSGYWQQNYRHGKCYWATPPVHVANTPAQYEASDMLTLTIPFKGRNNLSHCIMHIVGSTISLTIHSYRVMSCCGAGIERSYREELLENSGEIAIASTARDVHFFSFIFMLVRTLWNT